MRRPRCREWAWAPSEPSSRASAASTIALTSSLVSPELLLLQALARNDHPDITGLVDEIAGTTLRTALTVQHGLLPARERQFPQILELAHDYAAWHRDMIDAKDGEHRDDWPAVVPGLRDLPPGNIE
jgi:hypothetical protein